MPCAMNSARARGMSKLCATRMIRLIFAAPRTSADRAAFSWVLRDCNSSQRTGTPNSRSSAERIRVASGSPPNTEPPVTSTGKPVRRATWAP